MKCITLIILLLLSPCPVVGQITGKKYLSADGYDQWGTLSIKSISGLGGWTSYEMNYENKNDTLFLQNTDTKLQYAYPKGRNGSFGGERLFAYLSGEDLNIVTLKNYGITSIKGVKRFELLRGGNYIVTLHHDNTLEVRNFKGMVLQSIKGVTEYKLNHNRDALLYSGKKQDNYEVGCIQFTTYNHSIVVTGQFGFDGFTWQANGKSVVFSQGAELLYYRLEDRCLSRFDSKLLSGYEGFVTVKSGLTGFRISNDGKKVFFSIAKPSSDFPNATAVTVEVWNGNDKYLYPTGQELATRDTPKLAVWFPATGLVNVLSDDSLYRVRLTGSSNYVLLSNPYSYGLEPDYYEKVDYYIRDVQTGAEKLLLQKQSHDPNMLCVSPHDDRIVYYRDKNWWLYNPLNSTVVNLTKNIKTNWDNTDTDAPISFKVYGLAGWSADGKKVLLYDKHDIWEITLDGFTQNRLTVGKEEEKVYRISDVAFRESPSRAYDSGRQRVIDFKKNILLECKDNNQFTGYAMYSKSIGVKMLVFESKYFSDIKKGSNDTFIFGSQTFSQSPQVVFLRLGTTPQTLFKSNKQQVNYHYGYSELIYYTNSEGRQMRGVLFYPADYQTDQLYPMVVHVYEKMAYQLHRYVNPTLLNAQGFCVTNFTLNGYFVLMPDIAYKLGNPGISATDCITAAIKKTLATQNVNRERIGLIGHSFGGYQTDFIITQTDIFAVAVSGAGISDPIRHYFSLDKNGTLGKAGMWRYENQQFRMGNSFFNDKEAYWNNSPLAHADNIKTPLLQWAGTHDKIIPYDQSIAFYLALRRLGVPNILLIYPDEGHSIKLRNNQKDLTNRVQQWFDYYLKDKKDIEWIKNVTISY